MGRIAAACSRRRNRRQIRAGCRGLRGDASAQRPRVGPAGQARNGHPGMVRIAKKLGPVPIGAAHRLHDHVAALHRVEHPQLVAGKHVEHGDQGHPARRGRRRGDDPGTPVVSFDRLALHRPVACQIGKRPETAGPANAPHQAFGYGPHVEPGPPPLGQCLQGEREVWLRDHMAKRRNRISIEIHTCGGGVAPQHLEPESGQPAVAFVDREALACKPDGRSQGAREGQAAVVLRQVDQGGRLPRDAGRQATVNGEPGSDVALVIQIQIAVGRGRCPLAPVDHDLSTIRRAMQKPKAPAAEPGAVRFHDCKRRCHRHRGVKRVASFLQHGVSGLRGERMRTRHGRGRRRDISHGTRADQQAHRQDDDAAARPAWKPREGPSKARRPAQGFTKKGEIPWESDRGRPFARSFKGRGQVFPILDHVVRITGSGSWSTRASDARSRRTSLGSVSKFCVAATVRIPVEPP